VFLHRETGLGFRVSGLGFVTICVFAAFCLLLAHKVSTTIFFFAHLVSSQFFSWNFIGIFFFFRLHGDRLLFLEDTA
jgi:hypothetical protein